MAKSKPDEGFVSTRNTCSSVSFGSLIAIKGYELKKIALFLREISGPASQMGLNRSQRDIALISAKWLEKKLIGQ